eukprot:CAMPEP_0114591590 /NCGR_PEP_ID=MMETSP0125-20121206/13592_1 /TAXON_ID=485358 ORGANISM="Aristerostoma sp., Strain ATCC 50986" /NCGR_SAMPLE_ID=MMETSP0125 /ASSEMBLY_ACC=CAM_ASM_000245 /LENGTH=56 /DNA_ID=CAMNT_0001789737 /DNA_START=52 /DNA_END=222 /DNA_ORIENTATION=-
MSVLKHKVAKVNKKPMFSFYLLQDDLLDDDQTQIPTTKVSEPSSKRAQVIQKTIKK